MAGVIFSAGYQSFSVSQIIYAGPVFAIPAERQRNNNTYTFRLLTTVGYSYCDFKSEEDAEKARDVLENMLSSVKPELFHHAKETVDPRAVVSFGNSITLKTPQGPCTHAVILTMRTADPDNGRLWLLFTSEESAREATQELYRVIHAAVGATKLKAALAEDPALCGGA